MLRNDITNLINENNYIKQEKNNLENNVKKKKIRKKNKKIYIILNFIFLNKLEPRIKRN
jgi:hypothetical protein